MPRLVEENNSGIVGQVNNEEQKRTALMGAAFNGNTEIVRALLKARAAVDLLDDNSFSALMLASYNNRSEIVQILIDANASVNQGGGRNNVTPLMIASTFGHTEVVKILLDFGAQVDLKTTDGKTALDCAVGTLWESTVTPNRVSTVKLLISNGADISKVSDKEVVKAALSKPF